MATLVNYTWQSFIELTPGTGVQYRIPCQDFAESRVPNSGQISYPVNNFCVFPNPALYFGRAVIKRQGPEISPAYFHSKIEEK